MVERDEWGYFLLNVYLFLFRPLFLPREKPFEIINLFYKAVLSFILKI